MGGLKLSKPGSTISNQGVADYSIAQTEDPAAALLCCRDTLTLIGHPVAR
jgi:hypothetical protein